MNAEKRKRGDNGEQDGKSNRTKGNDVNGGLTVNDDEVDEFFAILKRIQVAVKYFEKSNGGRRKLTEKGWRPRFEAEDFDGDNGVNNNDNDENNGGKTEEAAEESSGFDLNSDPASTIDKH
ncbi:hypothetical protein Pint_23279 [Pistacia integerrima]|uniref:Uncharacterized protein n=1 Tax=Pistacia integerrima TaxID=434235 RepID=A0ACC0YIU6_9ROSI|nr:hypothetical protein Pint_23279 [Pistacia integerrima]